MMLVWAANVLGWPVIQLGISRAMLLLPRDRFDRDTVLTRERQWEREGRLYRDVFAIQRWKGRLPDGAGWLGGVPKKGLASRRTSQLELFQAETRRAELAHLLMLACAPIFYLWNPAWACIVMTGYGLATNIPCILAQRANRIHIQRLLRRKEGSRRGLAHQ